MKFPLLNDVFKIVLGVATLISFYIFVMVIICKDNTHKAIFTTWQFPMLFAIFIEVLYDL